MNRKRPLESRLHTKKTLLNEQENDKDSYLVCARRSQELFEIVSEENAINHHGKPQKIALSDVYTINYDSSESKSFDGDDENNYRELIFKERQKVMEECNIICRDNVKIAFNTFESNNKRSKKRLLNEKNKLNMLEKHCTKNSFSFQEHEQSWVSPIYIMKSIRSCILTRNWNNLTLLLLMLLKNRKRYVSYVKEVARLNLMNNPLDCNGEILEELYKLCMVSIHK